MVLIVLVVIFPVEIVFVEIATDRMLFVATSFVTVSFNTVRLLTVIVPEEILFVETAVARILFVATSLVTVRLPTVIVPEEKLFVEIACDLTVLPTRLLNAIEDIVTFRICAVETVRELIDAAVAAKEEEEIIFIVARTDVKVLTAKVLIVADCDVMDPVDITPLEIVLAASVEVNNVENVDIRLPEGGGGYGMLLIVLTPDILATSNSEEEPGAAPISTTEVGFRKISPPGAYELIWISPRAKLMFSPSFPLIKLTFSIVEIPALTACI